MRTYVVSFIDYFDSLLDIQKVVADNPSEAMCKYLRNREKCWEGLDPEDPAEQIREYVSNCDCAIAYIEI